MNVRQLASRVDPHGIGRLPGPLPSAAPAPATSFADALRHAEQAPDVHLSAHAQQRLAQRGIAFDAEAREAVAGAFDVLAQKGARDALLLRNGTAFVVNVPSRTVVTAAGQADLAERVFTQIDSAMIL